MSSERAEFAFRNIALTAEGVSVVLLYDGYGSASILGWGGPYCPGRLLPSLMGMPGTQAYREQPCSDV
jgi:hypothetical protein